MWATSRVSPFEETAIVFTLNTEVAFFSLPCCVRDAVVGGPALSAVISSLRQRSSPRHAGSLWAHTCNLTIWEVEAGGLEFKASLDDVRR